MRSLNKKGDILSNNNWELDISETQECKDFLNINIEVFVNFIVENSDELIALANDVETPYSFNIISFKKRESDISVLHNIATFPKMYIVALCLYVVKDIRKQPISERMAYFKLARDCELPKLSISKKAFFMKFIIEYINKYKIQEKYPLLYKYIKKSKSKFSKLQHCLFVLDPYYGLGYCKKCKTVCLNTDGQFGSAGVIDLEDCKFCGADLNETMEKHFINNKSFNYDDFLKKQENILRVCNEHYVTERA